MSVKEYTEEQIKRMSLMDVTNLVLAERKVELNFLDIFNEVAALKKFTETQKENMLSNFYTDLNVDGRFSTIGANKWGLKRWYRVDQTSEKALADQRALSEEEEEDDEDLLELGENEDDDIVKSNINDDFVDEIDLLEDDPLEDEEEVDDMGFADDEDEFLDDEDEEGEEEEEED